MSCLLSWDICPIYIYFSFTIMEYPSRLRYNFSQILKDMFLGPNILLDLTFSRIQNFCGHEIILDLKFFLALKIFSTKTFFELKVLGPIFFGNQNFFGPMFFF